VSGHAFCAEIFICLSALIVNSTLRINKMKNPLESVGGTIISGLLLLVVFVLFLKNFLV
jgi:hypothetical protein